jgi:hypothetical protein
MSARVDSKLRKKVDYLLRRAEGALLPPAERARRDGDLHALGKLRIANLDEVAKARDPVFRCERR